MTVQRANVIRLTAKELKLGGAMNFLKVTTVALATIFFVACANDDNINANSGGEPPQKPKSQNLSGKSTQEVLVTKYNKAVFYCDLWVQRGDELIKTNSPIDQLTWDLLNDFGTERTFNLEGQVQDHSFAVSVNVKSVEIYGSVRHTTVDGIVYEMEYTPVIEMDFDYEQQTVYGPGLSSKRTGFAKRQINERVPDMSLNVSHSSEVTQDSFFQYLECSVDTEIKDEYKDQFSVKNRP